MGEGVQSIFQAALAAGLMVMWIVQWKLNIRRVRLAEAECGLPGSELKAYVLRYSIVVAFMATLLTLAGSFDRLIGWP